MDDFEYSVQISEQDWDSFFRECEECNLLPPVLAGMEDSGMSDMDDTANRKAWMKPESRVPDPDLPTHGPDEEESPMDLYLSRYGMSSPLQVLSGSEEDTQMETVNVFFERLKSVSASEDTLRQKHSSNLGREMAGHLKGFAEVPVDTRASKEDKSMQKESYYSHTFAKSTANELAVRAHIFTCPDTDKMIIKEIHGSADVCQEMSLKTSLGKALCSALANGKDLISPIPEEAKKDVNSQLLIISDSDSKELLVCQGQTSSITPRRKRKKKKRMCLEAVEPDHGRVVQLQYKQIESDDDVFVRRKELDREIPSLGECSSGPGAEIDNISEGFPFPQLSLSGNVMEPTVLCPNSPTTNNSPSTLTAAQNKIRLDFMHEMSDLTGKQASAGQLAKPVNLMPTETGVPDKKAQPLMLPSDDSKSAPTNGDNVRSHSQLNSNLPSEIKAALKASEALPASISTCDQIKALSMTATNPGSSENPMELNSNSKEINNVSEDCKSLMLHHTANSDMKQEALLALLPSNPAGISQSTIKGFDTISQFQLNLTLSDVTSQCDKSGAAFETKTSASDNVSCATFPQITETISESLSELHNNAKKKQNVTCFSHEEHSPEHRNVHEIMPEICCNSTLPRQFDPLKVEKAKIIPKECSNIQNVYDMQTKASQSPRVDTVKDTGTKPKVKNARMVNESENSRQSVHSKSEVWTKEIPKSLKLDGITDLPGSKKDQHLRAVGMLNYSAAKDRNEERLKENSQPSTIITTGDEQKGGTNSLLHLCSSKTHELSPCLIMEGKTYLIPESTVDVLSNNNTTDLEEDCDVHYIPPHHPSKDLEALLSAAKKGVASRIAESTDGAEQTSLNSITTRNEKGPPVIPHCSLKEPEVSLSPAMSRNGMAIGMTIITTDNEEKKGKVQQATPQCPSKDPDVSFNPTMESKGSSIPVAISGAQQTSLKIIITGDEEKGNVHHVPPSCPSKDPEVSLIAVIENTTSPVYEPIGGVVEQTPLDVNVPVEEEKGKVSHVPPLITCKVPEVSLCHFEAINGMASSIPESISAEEHTSLNVIATVDDEKDNVHHVPLHHPSKDTEVYLLSPAVKSTASIPEANRGAEQTTMNVITTGDVEEVPHVLPHCPSQDPGVLLRTSIKGIVSPIDGADVTSLDVITKGPSKDPEISPRPITESPISPFPDSMDKAEHLSTHISTTGDEGKCGVHNVSQLCPSKYHESPLGADIKPDMACPIPEEEDRAKTPETLENNKGNLHSHSEGCREQIFPSLMTKDTTSLPVSVIPASGKDVGKIDIQSPASQDRKEELSLKEMTQACQPFIKITGPDTKLEDTEANKCVPGDDNNHDLSSSAIMKSVESLPLSQATEEHELLPSEIIEGTQSPSVATPSPTFDLVDEAKVIETSSAKSQSPHPVYAMSSFWNEMEKLTINDILRLRLVGQAQHPSVLLQPEDSGIADVSDAADSGYFTHLDDSKPDRSSGDMSYISDFDEELAQLQTQEAARLDEGSRDSPNSANYMWENDLDPAGTGTGMEEMFLLSSETAMSSPFYRDNAQQCFRKMCKNISVQNLQALEAQPLRKILRNASLISLHSVHSTHSIHSEAEEDYVDPFDRVEASSPVYLSDEEEEMESPGVTFSEIIQYLFGGDEPDRCASPADNIAASYLDGTGTSVPETYDHFFSEFEAGSIFNPLADDTSSSSNTELVPIFSCTRSANKNLQFPEVYDYFFLDDSPVHSDEDEEFDYTSIQVITRHDHMAAQSHNAVAELDTYEDSPSQGSSSWNFLRNNPLSFRRIRRTGFTAPPEESSSWALTPVKPNGRSLQRGIQPINAMGPDERPFQDPLLLSLENRIFRQLANQQKIQQEIQTAVADPRLDAPLMPLKQADMCLVCIAFASWVLKSANPQGADMWKAALLANISALSAIRYLRRYMRDEATKKTPLRQIEPA